MLNGFGAVFCISGIVGYEPYFDMSVIEAVKSDSSSNCYGSFFGETKSLS